MRPTTVWRRRSLAGRLALLTILSSAVTAALALALQAELDSPGLAWLLSTLLIIPFAGIGLHQMVAPSMSMYRALAGAVDSYRDHDFSFGLVWNAQDEMAGLVAAHNRLGQVLREERLALSQRELLLDTMVQHTPVAMVLSVTEGAIVYANLAARRLLNEGRRLTGLRLGAVLERSRAELRDALARGGDGVFSVGEGDEEDVYHLARRRFLLNGQAHELVLLRQLTAELRRQEVQTWKKVIRVMSHELNNALAPISSLAHSGAELVRRGDLARLPLVFTTIEERARHLDGFLRGYARFAKLPQPRLEEIDLRLMIERWRLALGFELAGEVPEGRARVDAEQFEQVITNLVRNAVEAGSSLDNVVLGVTATAEGWRLELNDRGGGMNESVIAQALAPFYSTKREGTGLGLALVREILEAHGGSVAIANREGGGLRVILLLPRRTLSS